MKTNLDYIGFHCGDVVRLRDSPRHEGEVVAVFNWTVRVKWFGTSWKSDESPTDLEVVESRRR